MVDKGWEIRPEGRRLDNDPSAGSPTERHLCHSGRQLGARITPLSERPLKDMNLMNCHQGRLYLKQNQRSTHDHLVCERFPGHAGFAVGYPRSLHR